MNHVIVYTMYPMKKRENFISMIKFFLTYSLIIPKFFSPCFVSKTNWNFYLLIYYCRFFSLFWFQNKSKFLPTYFYFLFVHFFCFLFVFVVYILPCFSGSLLLLLILKFILSSRFRSFQLSPLTKLLTFNSFQLQTTSNWYSYYYRQSM